MRLMDSDWVKGPISTKKRQIVHFKTGGLKIVIG